MNTNLNRIYDIEDDIIDRGDATNLSESLGYYQMDDNDKAEALNIKIEQDYHNTYYLGNRKYGTRTLKLANKDWHKLNKV